MVSLRGHPSSQLLATKLQGQEDRKFTPSPFMAILGWVLQWSEPTKLPLASFLLSKLQKTQVGWEAGAGGR